MAYALGGGARLDSNKTHLRHALKISKQRSTAMTSKETNISRRRFLQQSTTLGLGALIGPAFGGNAFAASRERVVIYQGVSLDSLHPYG
ncbi:MAG: twin-arginine translocation signal domain-containing protein, partial [Candidatus Binatia bacterium]